MNFYEQLEQGRYGSFELKKIVGPNLMRGLAISVIVHAIIISAPYIVQLIRGEEEIPPPPIHVTTISELTQLKSEDNTMEQVKIALPKLAAPKAAIPIPVPEEEVPKEQAMLPTQKEIIQTLAAPSDAGLDIKPGEKVEIREEVADVIPDASTFTPFEVAPQPLPDFSPQPDFPDIAKMSQMAGKVVVQVYVDKKGEVKKYKVVSAKPTGLGFEEEVEKVIMKWKFTPAIQQGNPVGVWIAIPFNFKFKK